MPNLDPTEPTFNGLFGIGATQDIDKWVLFKNDFTANPNLIPESKRWNFIPKSENFAHESWLAIFNATKLRQGDSPVREIQIDEWERTFEIGDDGNTYLLYQCTVTVRQKLSESDYPNPEDLY